MTSSPIFFSRIDGTLVNVTAYIGKKMKLDNGTIVMDIQKTFSSSFDESGVVLISLQFESGSRTSSWLLALFKSLATAHLVSAFSFALTCLKGIFSTGKGSTRIMTIQTVISGYQTPALLYIVLKIIKISLRRQKLETSLCVLHCFSAILYREH